MICEKTGAQIWSTEYSCYFYGDLYKLKGRVWVLKTVGGRQYNSVRAMLHGKFYVIDLDWSDMKPFGVIVCSDAVYYGYEGVPVDMQGREKI